MRCQFEHGGDSIESKVPDETRQTLRDSIHNSVTAYLYERTKRRPMVLPVIMQV